MALSDKKTVENVQELVQATTVVNAYIKFVLDLQDNINLPDFKTIDQHLKSAKANAQYWQTELYPLYNETTSNILQCSEFFCKTIKDLQDSLQNTTLSVPKSFEQELNKLIAAVDSVQHKITEVTAKINKFSEDEMDILQNFHSDAEKAQIEIIGDNTELESLQNQLNGIEKAISRDKILLAGGILSIWIAVGAGIDLKKQEDAKKNVELQIAMKKKELATISSFKAQYDQLNIAGDSISQALSQMQIGLSSLTADIQEVVTELKTLSTTEAVDYLRPLLDTALKDWMSVVGVARNL